MLVNSVKAQLEREEEEHHQKAQSFNVAAVVIDCQRLGLGWDFNKFVNRKLKFLKIKIIVKY